MIQTSRRHRFLRTRSTKSGAAETTTPPWTRSRLILRDARIDLLAPSCDTALHIVDVLEASVLQELDRLRAASAGLAVNDEVLVLIQLRQALRKLSQGY